MSNYAYGEAPKLRGNRENGVLPFDAHSKRLPVPEKLSGRIRKSFGLDAGQLRFEESPQVADRGFVAEAQGDAVRFAPGAYNPGTPEGLEVIGHELGHVVQQARGETPITGGVLEEPGYESAADQAGAAFASGSLSASGPVDAPGGGASAPVQGKGIKSKLPNLFGKKKQNKGEWYDPEKFSEWNKGESATTSPDPLIGTLGDKVLHHYPEIYMGLAQSKLLDKDMEKRRPVKKKGLGSRLKHLLHLDRSARRAGKNARRFGGMDEWNEKGLPFIIYEAFLERDHEEEMNILKGEKDEPRLFSSNIDPEVQKELTALDDIGTFSGFYKGGHVKKGSASSGGEANSEDEGSAYFDDTFFPPSEDNVAL